MTTKTARDALTLASAALKSTEVGQQYFRALKAYVEEARDAAIEAPPEWIHQTQGSARFGTILLRLIEASPEDARKIFELEDARKRRSNP